MWTIFKVFIECVTILFLFDVLIFLGTRHVTSYLPDQGLNLDPLHWNMKVEPLNHQGSPLNALLIFSGTIFPHTQFIDEETDKETDKL